MSEQQKVKVELTQDQLHVLNSLLLAEEIQIENLSNSDTNLYLKSSIEAIKELRKYLDNERYLKR